MNNTTLEIPAIPFDGDNPPPKRLLIIPNINVFWDGDQPEWTEERIWQVMGWTDLDYGAEYFGRLIVASPELNLEQYRNRSFQHAWEKWANHMSYELWLKWTVSHGGPFNPDEVTDEFGMLDADWTAMCTFYPKEFFDTFVDDHNHHEAWKEILYHVPGIKPGHGWYGLDASSRTLIEHCEHGDTHVEIWADYDGSDDIEEIYILECIDGKLQARAFMVPRAYDPAGHLP